MGHRLSDMIAMVFGHFRPKLSKTVRVIYKWYWCLIVGPELDIVVTYKTEMVSKNISYKNSNFKGREYLRKVF